MDPSANGSGIDIFDGQDIRVVARLFKESQDHLVITFTGRAANPPVDKGFGETYLAKRRVSAVHFISKDNHWWQTAEPQAAISELRARGLIDGTKKITLYGSSMGGYAALILSRLLKPKRIVLFSPQYSIDALRVPFEKRWRSYAAKLKFDYDDMSAGLDLEADVKVVYDPFFEPDRRHVELIERLRPVAHIPVCFAGHNTARTLEELGIIGQVIDDLLFGDFSVANFLHLYRSRRPASSLFWYGLSQTLSGHDHHAAAALTSYAAATIVLSSGRMKDPALRRDILRHAVSMAYTCSHTAIVATWLAELGKIESSSARIEYVHAVAAWAGRDWAQAGRRLDIALAKSRSDPAYVALKIEVLGKASGPAAALHYSSSLPASLGRVPTVLLAKARLLAYVKDWKSALDVLQQCLRHDRLNPAARALATKCWLELGRPEAAMKNLSPMIHYYIASDEVAEEIAQLFEQVRGRRHGDKVRARHKRYNNLLRTLIGTLDSIDWTDRNNGFDILRRLSQLRPIHAIEPPSTAFL